MLPPRPSPLRHSHPCLSPTYTRSVFEGGFEVLRPSVRGMPTTHSEGLLLRVGALQYLVNLLTTVAWYSTWSSIVWGLHSHTNAPRRPQRAMQTASNDLYRGRNCCTMHAAKVQIFSRDTHASSSSRNPRTSTNGIFYYLLAASICCHRDRRRCILTCGGNSNPV